jgi:microcystin-dependent protein
MALPVRKGYKGAPAKAVLTSTATDSDLSFVVDTVAGWATTFPFYCVVEPGTSKEEKVKVTAISGVTLTVVRAQDDTAAQGHNDSAAIYPVFTADEADEANEIASVMTTKGDLIGTNGSSINRLGIGTNTHVLQADSTATNGFKWGQVVEAGIADSAVTSAKIANGTIIADDLADSAVTSAKILDNTIELGDLATALQAYLVPIGTIIAFGSATPPTGWLSCDGGSTTGYAALAAVVGATVPDLRGRTIIGTGTGAGLTARTINATGGAETHSLTAAQSGLPNHSHNVATAFVDVATGGTRIYPVDPGGTGTAYPATISATADAAQSHNNMQPFYALNYIIKH